MFRRISTWLINNRFISKNIIDLGSWMGDNSIPWAKNTTGTVYAIDPSKNNCEFIRQVCEMNSITNVTILERAISDREEVLATNDLIDHCSFHEGSNGKISLTATSLDTLHSQGILVDIDYVHLDVEGMEFKVLKGMSGIISAYNPIIAFEQHVDTDVISNSINFLKDRNYTVFMINEVLPGCRFDCRNFIAFPDTKKYSDALRCIRSYFGNDRLFTCF
jgi:FkbM family methyltransferase